MAEILLISQLLIMFITCGLLFARLQKPSFANIEVNSFLIRQWKSQFPELRLEYTSSTTFTGKDFNRFRSQYIELKNFENSIFNALHFMLNETKTTGREWFSYTEIGEFVHGPKIHDNVGFLICRRAARFELFETNGEGRYKPLGPHVKEGD